MIYMSSSTLPNDSPSPGPSTPNGMLADPYLNPVKFALARWRTTWTAIRSSFPSHVWTTYGIISNSDNYWLVTQLLINSKGSVDLLKGMEVNCDTLEQFRKLLPGNTSGESQ